MKNYTPKEWIKSNLITNKKIKNLEDKIGGDLTEIEESISEMSESIVRLEEKVDESSVYYIHGSFSSSNNTCIVTESGSDIIANIDTATEIIALFDDLVKSKTIELRLIHKDITRSNDEIQNVTLFFGNSPEIYPHTNSAEIINIVVNATDASSSGKFRLLTAEPPMIILGAGVGTSMTIQEELEDIVNAVDSGRTVYLQSDYNGINLRLTISGYGVQTVDDAISYFVVFNTITSYSSGVMIYTVTFENSKTGTIALFSPEPLT